MLVVADGGMDIIIFPFRLGFYLVVKTEERDRERLSGVTRVNQIWVGLPSPSLSVIVLVFVSVLSCLSTLLCLSLTFSRDWDIFSV